MRRPRRSLLAAALLLELAAACALSRGPGKAAEQSSPEGLVAPAPVASSPEDDFAPSVSADGRLVVYASEANGNLDLWVRNNATNSTFPLTFDNADDFDPALSPDGQLVAFVSRRQDAKGDLYLASIAARGGGGPSSDERGRRILGASVERALPSPESWDRQPIFAPGGRRIYFTSSLGIGLEFVRRYDLEEQRFDRVSPTPGFDPAPSPDGRYLIYTAPEGVGGREHPHLVALRLADSSTRAVGRRDTPEGFARLAPEGGVLVFVRFVDDDNGDGVVDGNDQASLWQLELDLDQLFAGAPGAVSVPVPLTDGSKDELFPALSAGGLYFTQGDRQQDILRLPRSGMFPAYADPEQYLELAPLVADPRTRWFVLRAALARLDPSGAPAGRALFAIGELHLERGRPDLARQAFLELARALAEARGESPEAELLGAAEAELSSLDRRLGLERAAMSVDRERVIRAARARLEGLLARFSWSPRVSARVELELAELLLDSGQRSAATVAFGELAERREGPPRIAARAMLRQVELLGVAHDPDAIGEAYARVLERFPGEPAVVEDAARRLVRAQVAELGEQGARAQADALTRVLPRYGPGPVRTAARWALVELHRASGGLDLAALHLERLVVELEGDRLGLVRALRKKAETDEQRGERGLALGSLARLRSGFGDLPGVAAEARDTIDRVGLLEAAGAEARGDKRAARAAYQAILDNDPGRVRAHRRYLALSAEAGDFEQALEQARERARLSPDTPVFRWAYALALTWQAEPALSEALAEVDAAIALNPKFVAAYNTRAWIHQMRDLDDRGWFYRTKVAVRRVLASVLSGLVEIEVAGSSALDAAIKDYNEALRLNPEEEDPETEAELRLNLGNASYQLGERTNDVGHFRRAFNLLVEAHNAGVDFGRPEAEMVFFERLGRAAIWSGEPVVAVMATRRALSLAEEHPRFGRQTQLLGNLALAFDQAGDEVRATQTLRRYLESLGAAEDVARLTLARRNSAVARLKAAREDPRELDRALLDLAAAAAFVVEERASADERRGDYPIWRPTVADASSGQFGFGDEAELDLLRAITGRVHAARGEQTRVEELEAERQLRWPQVLDDRSFGEPSLAELVRIRERVGLSLARVGRLHRAGRHAEAQAQLEEIDQELRGWLEDGDYLAQRPGISQELARVVAWRASLAAVDRAAGRVVDLPAVHAALDAAEETLDRVVRAPLLEAGLATATSALSLLDPPALASLPLELTSTAALARTSSQARSPSPLDAEGQQTRAARARLALARGLLLAAEAESSAPAGGLSGLLSGLDADLDRLARAERELTRAAREAAGAGAGGRALYAAALDGLGYTAARLARPAPLAAAVGEEAVAQGEAAGRGDLALGSRLAGALSQGPAGLERGLELVSAADPYLLAPHLELAGRVLARSASRALARGEVGRAVELADRWMLLLGAAQAHSSLDGAVSAADGELSAQVWRARRAVEEARAELLGLDARAGAEALRRAEQRVADSAAGLARLRERELSDAARARLYAEPLLLDLIADHVPPDGALLVPLPVDGELRLLWVDGSTTASTTQARLAAARSPASPAALSLGLRQAREQLAQGARLAPAERARLLAGLLGELAPRLAGKRRLVLADALIDGPAPAALFPPDLGISHVSAPTNLRLAREALEVGVEGAVVLAGELALDLPGERLDAAGILGFRRVAEEQRGLPRDERRLEDRPPVERLRGQAKEQVVVEAPLHLEPGALERSPILVRTSTDPWDRVRGELPLEALTIPARLLVLGRVHDGGQAGLGLRLDLPLALRGVPTTLLVPAVVPAPAARRVLASTLAEAARLGPDLALAQAVAAESEASPEAALIHLVGAPGLDREETARYAKAAQKGAQSKVVSLVNKNRWEAAVPALERWIRLMRVAGDEKPIPGAYKALVNALTKQVTPPDWVRAADRQLELVRFFEGKKNERAAAEERLGLGRIYSEAGDHPRAQQALRDAIRALELEGRALEVARGYFELGADAEKRRAPREAVAFLEEAVARYERENAYTAKTVPPEAVSAVRRLGRVYLNTLSDPKRARRALERAHRLVPSEEDRVRVLLDLARVGRRSGDFTEALELALRAQKQASDLKRADLEAEGLIEAANVAWYQGDYRAGQDLCQASLAKVQGMKEETAPERRVKKQRRIWALSVCGLVAMSRRERERAESTLLLALDLAQSARDQPEIATQLNNLGRIYLEFGQLERAEEYFRRAQAIDVELADRFALAYDLRNLGTALAARGKFAEARSALDRGLGYALEVGDENNEVRARFALAELARDEGQLARAKALYLETLPKAQALDLKELAWQIQRALGLIARAEGDAAGAEARLREATQIARTLTGRSGAADYGPQRYAAFDDLILLLLELRREEEALALADATRSLEQAELFDDARVGLGKEVPGLLYRLRSARSASVAEDAARALAAVHPRLARLVVPEVAGPWRAALPPEALVLLYRITERALIIFTVESAAVGAVVVPLDARTLLAELGQYTRVMSQGGALDGLGRQLAARLIDPVAPRLAGKTRLVIVPHGALRYVPFAALPAPGKGEGELLLDHYLLGSALHLRAAHEVLAAPLGALGDRSVTALGGAPPQAGAFDPPLHFAEKELALVRESAPGARLLPGPAATRQALLAALASETGVLHFAGHTRLRNREGAGAELYDPLSGELVLADGGVSLVELSGQRTRAELVVLSSCSGLIQSEEGARARPAGEDLLAATQVLAVAGAQHVLSSTLQVNDVAAAMVMKRFYRALRAKPALEALREAQRVVRRFQPHPAWWATFSLTAG